MDANDNYRLLENYFPLSERTCHMWPWCRRQVKLRKAKLTECTEDDRSASKLLSGPHGGYDQLILRVSPKAAQGDRFTIACDHRHHPVTNHLAVMIPRLLTITFVSLIESSLRNILNINSYWETSLIPYYFVHNYH